IPIYALREVPNAEVELKIEILEPYFQADAEPKILKFETRKFEPPDLVIYDKGVEEGEIVPGKSSNIALIIQNQGTGRAEDVRVEIKVPPGITYLEEKPVFDFGTMESGAWQKIAFPIFVGARFQAESLKIILTLNEKRQEFSKALAAVFPLNRPIQKPKEIVVKGEERTPTGTTLPPVLTVDVDINIPESKIENSDAIAVVIANKQYEAAEVPDVDYADNDGKILKEYLKKTLGYKEENIIFLENAKKSDFERVFGSEKDYKGKLYNYVKANKSDVFIYYTGHGAPDIETKSGYFVPVDCHPDYIRLNGYALETFYKNLLQIPAKSITVVIDACFSGASERGMLIAQASPLVVASMPKEISGNLNLFTSSGPDEISSWYPEKRHSLFTYYFLKALQGEGDKNKDEAITLGELKEYVSENVSYRAQRLNRKQTPTFKGDEKMVMLRLKPQRR
ncbi:MAG: caspase family protein, partial [bacterium]